MKRWFLYLLVFPLAACSSVLPSQLEQPSLTNKISNLPDLGEAPELVNGVWLNTDTPLRLSELQGRVVLLDMWTFG
jgi:hypothetical protein